MRRTCLLFLLAFAITAAHADSIPAYNMTQGTVSLTGIDPNSFSITWGFTNGSGLNLSGQDSGGTCLDFSQGGGSCNPGIIIGLNQNAASLNGSIVGIFGTVGITGANFLLPANGSSFSITLPVLFSGTFETCPFEGPPSGGCTVLNKTGLFNINGPGTVNLSFLGVDSGNGTAWQFTSATYTLNAVPEPASIVLLGTGALAIFGKLRRRKS